MFGELYIDGKYVKLICKLTTKCFLVQFRNLKYPIWLTVEWKLRDRGDGIRRPSSGGPRISILQTGHPKIDYF